MNRSAREADEIIRVARHILDTGEYECLLRILIAWNDTIISKSLAEYMIVSMFDLADAELAQHLRRFLDDK